MDIRDDDRFFVNEEERCPICGSATYSYNNPGDDSSQGTYCINESCPWFSSEFMPYGNIEAVNRGE